MEIPIYSASDLAGLHDGLKRDFHDNYLAMYSSIWQGLVTDPVLMTVPVDDHMVHRGDGVFEVFKTVNGKAYCMVPHLERLLRSAAPIYLEMPPEYDRIQEIIKMAARAGGNPDVLVRVMVSRGPGGFTANPTECPAGQLYVIISKLHHPAPEKREKGIRIVSAPIPIKVPPFANIKSCNYLINVLIKKYALDAGVDYAVTWDFEGFLAEGSTENAFLISEDNELLMPEFDRVLPGITARRVLDLARGLVDEGLLKAARTARIEKEQAEKAREVMLCGTTMDILPVVEWDGRTVGQGRPGEIFARLYELLIEDQTQNDDYLTPLFA